MGSVFYVNIKGNHLDKLKFIFETFNYTWTGNIETYTSWSEELYKALSWPREGKPRTLVYKAITYVDGWTIILDPEGVMEGDKMALGRVASELNTTIGVYTIQTTSGSFGFSYYDPDQKRRFISIEGEVYEDFGAPLPAETDIDLNRIFVSDVLQIMSKTSINAESIESAKEIFLIELDESDYSTESDSVEQ